MRFIVILLFAGCLQVSTSHADSPTSPTEATLEFSPIFPIAFSLLSIFLSLVALYYTRWRRSKIDIVADENLCVQHFSDGLCAVSVHVILKNRGANFATVRRLGLLIQEKDKQEGYLLDKSTFRA